MVHAERFKAFLRTAGILLAVAVPALLWGGATPAWAGATTYDIAVLLYETHPWVGGRAPDAGAPAGPDRWRITAPPPAAGPATAMTAGRGTPAAGPGRRPGPYSLYVYGGVASEETFTRSWKFATTDTQLAAIGATARLFTFDFGLEIEAEIGMGRRFGQDKLWEGWVGAGLRWRDFPWNDTVITTFGVGLVGLDYTTKVPPHEVEHHGNRNERLLNYFSPEITLALPEHPDLAMLLRLHHRSPAFGLFDDGAATFYSVGLRFQL